MIKCHALDASAARAVERAARYLVNNTKLLHDDRALADGLPISTSVIGGACHHLLEHGWATQVRAGPRGRRVNLVVACAPYEW